MALGLVVYDLLYLTLAALLYGGAAWTAARTAHELQPRAPAAVAWALATVAALLALILEVGLLTALLPALRPGRYQLMKGRVFYGWLLRSMLRRVLFLPALKWIFFNSNVLRFLALRALGARIAFTASLSADVDILDPALTTIGPGALIGARCALSCHYVENGTLVLDVIEVGARALLAAEVGIGPGCRIGARAFVKPRTTMSIQVTVGEGADIGIGATLDALSSVGAGATVGTGAYVPVRGVVPAGGRVEAFTSASSTRSSAAPAV